MAFPTMPVDVSTEIEIARPALDVAAFAFDPDNATRWYANIKSVAWRTPRPLRVGSRLAFVAHFLGRELVYTYEVIELDPERRLVMRTADGPFVMETTYAVESLSADRARMRLRNRGEPSGLSRFVGPLMSFAMRRENRKDLARLKRVIEHPN